MGLFSKKEEVPEIPAAPVLPELPKATAQPEKKDLPELPSFPSTPQNENINQEMVKSAVADVPASEESELPSPQVEGLQVTEEQPGIPTVPATPSIQESTPAISTLPAVPTEPTTPSIATEAPTPSISDIPKKTLDLNATMPNKPVAKQAEPIFVRIDRFQSAQKNFEDVKDKVKEIESILRKVKDVKSQEEVELKGWTEDVEKIKSRLAEIDAGIFNQI